MDKILVIDDERSIRNSLKDILSFEDYDVDTAEDGLQAIEKIKNNNYKIVFCDIKMPQMDGIEVLERSIPIAPDTSFIMISGHGNIDTAVECIKKGAFDFIEKPIDLNRLLITVKNARERGTLIQEKKVLKKKISNKDTIIGSSDKITQILNICDKVAETDARVLITGENGTGKELIAKRLHDNSTRKDQPFIEVNCAAIPSELIESELFGHEKGAFTSANKQRKGKFEQANNGTIFLDEIGDMSASAQAKVLRALQENCITRVGGDKHIKINVRVIAATNKNLQEEINQNTFREDLYHRLSVILIHVPALKDRLDDIPALSKYFITEISKSYGKAPKKISNEAIKLLQEKRWTGNIRELRNIIERLLILSDDEITKEDIANFT
ncbi:sigma-54 dependent transcriptional regulator [Halosquirtibacter xylanolyticus]|uniref:sigma-54-dependent transcriptional regulator n=1 Tax=Halosquirtibacter xylanolyticus TaxID=3374599 RepID=UPI003749CCA2|nr:sigma-54 dependent transcriptional regulator [Prolixibacteraceae bacterium]